jgi:integrase/recombinase XerC/integrase/recombinase XerD
VTLADYQRHLEANYTPATVRVYLSATRLFLDWCARSGRRTATVEALQAYLDDLARTAAPITVQKRRGALATFLHYLGIRFELRRVKTPRVVRRESRFLDLAGLDRYVAHVTRRVRSDACRTVLLLLPHTGLRIGEMCALTDANIVRLGDGIGLRFCGKGGKERTVPLHRDALALLRDYLKRRGPGAGLLFPVTPGTVRERMAVLRAELGLPWLTPHKLRHTFGYSLVKRGVHLKTVAKLLGHSTTRQTEIYTHVDGAMERAAVEQLAGVVPARPRLDVLGPRK